MHNTRSESGFSLVEMMVVLVIIGLMTSAVVLSMPDKNTALLQTAERTEKAMTALSRRSIMTGEILGVRFSPVGFDVLKLTDNGWEIENTILKPRSQVWTGVVPITLLVNSTQIDFSSKTTNPHVWFLPTGEHPAFELLLTADGQRAEVSADPYGVVRALTNG